MMTSPKTWQNIDAFRKALKDKGLKATPQRLVIHEAMMAMGHASADMVVSYISEHSPSSITTASVYNNLLQLSQIGIYSQRLSSQGKMFFDVNPTRHMHLFDPNGNEYKDVFDDELMDMIESHIRKKRFKGYKVDGLDIQIICHPNKRSTNQ